MNQNTKILQIPGVLALIYEYQRKVLIDYGYYKKAQKSYGEQKFFLPDYNTEKFWDDQFEERKSSFPMEEWRNKKVTSLIKGSNSVLNIGVGKGFLEEKLFRKYKYIKYVGTDITQKTLIYLSKKFPNKKFTKSNVTNLPFKNKKFDLVLLLEVLEHIQPPKTFRVLSESYRVLSDNGVFVISVPVNEGLEKMLPNNPNSHMRIYSEQLISFELIASGFKIEKVYRASAFNKLFFLKHIINSLFFHRQPNNLIFVCRK